MVKQHFENTINQLKAEKERQVSVVRERVTREQIIPHNNEVNQSRDKAIAELSAKLNSDITKLQEQFAIEKQALIDVGEKNKNDFANTAISTETAIISKKYDDAIADLNALINKIKE
jgi:uncharacterized membrane-anchored protein YhcB (DUF1043 family)